MVWPRVNKVSEVEIHQALMLGKMAILKVGLRGLIIKGDFNMITELMQGRLKFDKWILWTGKRSDQKDWVIFNVKARVPIK